MTATKTKTLRKHVECRIDDDRIYVYIHEDGAHVETRHVIPPDSWWEKWPSAATVRRLIHDWHPDLRGVRITSLDS